MRMAIALLIITGGTLTMAQEKNDVAWAKVQEKIQTGRPFTLALLKSGPKSDFDTTTAERLQKEHLIHLFQLHDEGKLLIWGPLVDDTDLRGIAIFNTADAKEVEKWLSEDAWMKAGGMVFEIHPWFSLPGLSLPK
ncbi:hypothetical protein HUU42_01705 [bacterium]|nr:hypothetical protein [bacterium]